MQRFGQSLSSFWTVSDCIAVLPPPCRRNIRVFSYLFHTCPHDLLTCIHGCTCTTIDSKSILQSHIAESSHICRQTSADLSTTDLMKMEAITIVEVCDQVEENYTNQIRLSSSHQYHHPPTQVCRLNQRIKLEQAWMATSYLF